ncbi:MAG: hypothetical protein FWG80_01450 [Alphaproteobacteria bacterium]|nr:hypothetical protein [Alphaproteobacteria bacterium]
MMNIARIFVITVIMTVGTPTESNAFLKKAWNAVKTTVANVVSVGGLISVCKNNDFTHAGEMWCCDKTVSSGCKYNIKNNEFAFHEFPNMRKCVKKTGCNQFDDPAERICGGKTLAEYQGETVSKGSGCWDWTPNTTGGPDSAAGGSGAAGGGGGSSASPEDCTEFQYWTGSACANKTSVSLANMQSCRNEREFVNCVSQHMKGPPAATLPTSTGANGCPSNSSPDSSCGRQTAIGFLKKLKSDSGCIRKGGCRCNSGYRAFLNACRPG